MYTKLVISSFIQAISRIRIRLFLLLIIVGGQLTSQAQLRYNFERINTESGLPTNAIKGLQFDEKTRFLWVATESGIVRYNGYGFQSFGDDSKTVALNGRIVYFDKTQNGKLYGKLMDERVFFIQENKAVIDPEIQKLDGEINNLNYKYSLTSERSKLRFFEVENKDFIFRKNIYTKIDHTLFVYKTNQLNLISDSVEYDTEFIIRDKLFVLLNNGKVQQIDFKQNKLYVIKQYFFES
jgi:hypothetical protein